MNPDEMTRQFNNMLRYNNESLSRHEVEICHMRVIIENLEKEVSMIKMWVKCCGVSILSIWFWILCEMFK
jgi:hypothetical protein